MAAKNQQATPEQNTPESHESGTDTPVEPVLSEAEGAGASDHELFSGEPGALSGAALPDLEQEVFVGEKDFYKFLTESAQVTDAQSQRSGAGASQSPAASTSHKRFSTVQKVLVVGIVQIGRASCRERV